MVNRCALNTHMRPESLLELIRYEASRSPLIADLVEKAPQMTDEEIDALDVPLFWYKDGLKAIRSQSLMSNMAMVMEVILRNHEEFVPDAAGDIAVWAGDDIYLETERGTSILLQYGRLLFFPDTGGVWFETTFSRDPKALQARRTHRGTKSSYTKEYKDRLLSTSGNAPMTVVRDSKERPLTTQYGVRFS